MGFSVKEIAQEVDRFTSVGAPLKSALRRPSGPVKLVGDSTKHRDKFSWYPGFAKQVRTIALLLTAGLSQFL